MRIALDAMGTDAAPASEIAGAASALRELDPEIELLLVGDRDVIEAGLSAEAPFPRERLTVIHAPDRILPGESPVSAVRRKPESSIAVGLKLQRTGEADAFISAGSTGAVMASSLFILRPLPGVDRPAIGTLLPTTAPHPTLMLDAGANVDCKPHHLVQFGRLGTIYAQDLLGIESPRVGLLNIGEEPEKGDEVSVEAHALLQKSGLNFVGNVEGRDIVQGACDVLVCDGFVGNVLLKFYESVAQFIVQLMSQELAASGTRVDLSGVLRSLDYAEYGGAPLLGVNGISIICHGKSSPRAIQSAIRFAALAVRSGMVANIARELAAAAAHAEEEAT